MRAVEMLDPGSASREVQQWITDVLNGGTGAAAAMEKALVRLRGEILKALDGQGTAGVAEAVGRFHGLVQCTVRYKTFANWIEFMGIDFDAIRKSVTDVELAGVGDLEDRKALEAAKALIEGVRRFCKAADKTLFTEPVEPFRPHGWGKQPTQGKPAENKAAENKPADPVVTVHLPPGSAGAAGAADDLRVNVATLHAKARFSAQKDRGVIVAGNVFIPAAHIAPHWHVVGERGPVVFKVARNTHIHLTEGDVLRGDALRKVHAFLDANRGIAGWDSMKAYADYLSEP